MVHMHPWANSCPAQSLRLSFHERLYGSWFLLSENEFGYLQYGDNSIIQAVPPTTKANIFFRMYKTMLIFIEHKRPQTPQDGYKIEHTFLPL